MERYVDLFMDDPEVGELYTRPVWRKILARQTPVRKRRKER